ncbi:NeuD/PglB/VioB family sugar acetyltransferase [Algoriphagus mannitolivorans]|uniref:NeuD/PglB/VioB family sugar acetyltransferase n=1 Tax=Algoriphagus mannitolivorans TaxID=226504 RepID=UPI000401D64F|nr:NeuD/PglB/VioB family sugar acetyltransferase [Algoriphagus mannitolivorans]
MIIAGAGGHGKEVLALIRMLEPKLPSCIFFDQNQEIPSTLDRVKVIKSIHDLQSSLTKYSTYFLGVGNPEWRENLDLLLSENGGVLGSIHAPTSVIQSELSFADVMSFGFVGPMVQLGRGVLVNTRAQVHHDCQIGDYSEIGPGAIVLGNVRMGKKCRIGAGAVILPGIDLGDEVIVGAGAVVTKNILAGEVVAGVPAASINSRKTKNI